MGIANLGDKIMKRKIYCTLMITVACLTIWGCAGNTSDETTRSIFEPQTEAAGAQNDNQDTVGQSTDTTETVSSDDGRVSICDETTELDYSKDYTDEIKVAVERAVTESDSFDEEFAKIKEIEDSITARRSDSESQSAMNMAAGYYFQVWDCELNNLWSRFSEQADSETKERVLADQRNWNDMKEEAALEALGPREQGGSIYPVLYLDFMENSTKTRCYAIAKELSKINGSAFTMPEKTFDGMYVDNQGTGSIYGSLVITSGWESGFDAKISMYRIGELEGSVEENGQGGLSFVSFDDNVKGTITYGWDGATFEVTEAGEGAIVSAGEVFEFPFVF